MRLPSRLCHAAHKPMTSSGTATATSPFANVPSPSAAQPAYHARREPLPIAANHAKIATVTAQSSSASMIAKRPITACISAVESTTLANRAARTLETAATAYPTTAAAAIVASADGRRSANSVKPKAFAASAASQK